MTSKGRYTEAERKAYWIGVGVGLAKTQKDGDFIQTLRARGDLVKSTKQGFAYGCTHIPAIGKRGANNGEGTSNAK